MWLIRFFEALRTDKGISHKSGTPQGVAVSRDNNHSLLCSAPQKYKPGRGGHPDSAGRMSGVCLQRGWRDERECRARRVSGAASVRRWTCRETGGGGRRGGGWRGRVQVKGEFSWGDQTEPQRRRDRCTSSQTALIKSGRWGDTESYERDFLFIINFAFSRHKTAHTFLLNPLWFAYHFPGYDPHDECFSRCVKTLPWHLKWVASKQTAERSSDCLECQAKRKVCESKLQRRKEIWPLPLCERTFKLLHVIFLQPLFSNARAPLGTLLCVCVCVHEEQLVKETRDTASSLM